MRTQETHDIYVHTCCSLNMSNHARRQSISSGRGNSLEYTVGLISFRTSSSHRTSDHVDHTISRYRSRIHRAYDIVVAIYRTISCMNTSHACAAHAPQWQHLHLIDVTCRAHHPWLPLPHIRCGGPMMQHIGSLGWGLGDGSCTSGGIKYACRKAHCAHRTT